MLYMCLVLVCIIKSLDKEAHSILYCVTAQLPPLGHIVGWNILMKYKGRDLLSHSTLQLLHCVPLHNLWLNPDMEFCVNIACGRYVSLPQNIAIFP